jgi:hypothetical protein
MWITEKCRWQMHLYDFKFQESKWRSVESYGLDFTLNHRLLKTNF